MLLIVVVWHGRRLRWQISKLEARLGDEMSKSAELEQAIEQYYVPAWHDAMERLASTPICTCPPYPYRSSCPKHSPEKRKQQLRALEEAAARFPLKDPAMPTPVLNEIPELNEISETEELAADLEETSA